MENLGQGLDITAHFSLLVNGTVSGFFSSSRGLHRDDHYHLFFLLLLLML